MSTNETTLLWREYRQEQQERRAARKIASDLAVGRGLRLVALPSQIEGKVQDEDEDIEF